MKQGLKTVGWSATAGGSAEVDLDVSLSLRLGYSHHRDAAPCGLGALKADDFSCTNRSRVIGWTNRWYGTWLGSPITMDRHVQPSDSLFEGIFRKEVPQTFWQKTDGLMIWSLKQDSDSKDQRVISYAWIMPGYTNFWVSTLEPAWRRGYMMPKNRFVSVSSDSNIKHIHWYQWLQHKVGWLIGEGLWVCGLLF